MDGRKHREKAGSHGVAEKLLAKRRGEAVEGVKLSENLRAKTVTFREPCEDALAHNRHEDSEKQTYEPGLRIEQLLPFFGSRQAASIRKNNIWKRRTWLGCFIPTKNVFDNLPVCALENQQGAFRSREVNDALIQRPRWPEMHILDSPNVVALVHPDSFVRRLAMEAANVVRGRLVGGKIHRLIRIYHLHIDDRHVVAIAAHHPRLRRQLLSDHMIRIKHSDAFDGCVGAMKRDERRAFRVS